MALSFAHKTYRLQKPPLGREKWNIRMCSLLIPFLTDPKSLMNKFIVLYVDNISLIYAWEKKYCKNDDETSILIRCLHILEAFLECRIFVEHVKRRSNKMATLVDNLSRESSTTAEDLEQIQGLQWHSPQGNLNR